MAGEDHDGLFLWRQGQKLVRNGPLDIKVPAIVLCQPKYPHNVGQAVRNASCWGIEQVWFSGNRVDMTGEHFRIPREERMRGYENVTLINDVNPLDRIRRQHPDCIPIAVELRPNAECIFDFEHPEKAVYVFGPEDGSLTGPILKQCHRFVVFPTRHCLNLANSVNTILFHRNLTKEIRYDVSGEQRVMYGK